MRGSEMWANYAKYFDSSDAALGHGGVCIEYACDENWRSVNLHPVLYSDDIPRINPVPRDEAELVKAVYSKSSEWRCENEWRAFMVIQSTPPFPENLTENSKIRVEGGVSGVVFGLKTPNEIITEVRQRLEQASRKISLRQVVRDPTTYDRVLRDVV